jgi:hypothetical protein
MLVEMNIDGVARELAAELASAGRTDTESSKVPWSMELR